MHHFRDGAPFLLLIETPSTVGHSAHVSCTYSINRRLGGCRVGSQPRLRVGASQCRLFVRIYIFTQLIAPDVQILTIATWPCFNGQTGL